MEKKFNRLFAFDLDGTLVHDTSTGDRLIPSSLLEVVFKLSEQAYVMVATGRRVRSSIPVIETLPEMEFGVFHNGLIVRRQSGEIIVRRKIHTEEVEAVSSVLRELGQAPILVLDGHRNEIDFAFEETSTLRDRHTTYAFNRSKGQSLMVRSFSKILEDYHDHLLEVACIGDYYRLTDLRDQLVNRLPERLRAVVVRNCGYEGRSVLEIFDAQASKRSGVEYVKDILKADEVVAIGDDENDIEMLEWADKSISMKHALPHVKEKAQLVVDGPKGLEEYLRETWLK